MVSTSIPGMHGWGNLYAPALPGAHGLSPCYGGGLGVPFVFGPRVTDRAEATIQRAEASPVLQYPVTRDIPVQLHFLVRLQLLTRILRPYPPRVSPGCHRAVFRTVSILPRRHMIPLTNTNCTRF